VALVAWLPSGPLGSDWARRAGTPAAILARATGSTSSSTTTAGSSTTTTISAFQADVSGTISQSTTASGLAAVDIALTLPGSQLPVVHLQIVGNRDSSGGVQMTSSTVTAGTSADPQLYSGQITSLSGTDIGASVSSGTQALSLAVALEIDERSGTVTGRLAVSPR
jgi:hypothetical protein